MKVYVLNMRGKPLMPCSPCKARKLLKTNKAKVVRRTPFQIQLTYATGETVQPVTLGVDSGSKTIGLSAATEKAELYASEVELRQDIVGLLATRREFRRARRNRKTRYRAPRFENRVRSKHRGWLAPSVENKIQAHLSRVEAVCRLLPISKIRVETASFDTQKIKNPDISGTQYQQGSQLDFWNVREYVLFRDDHVCQHCHGKSKDRILNVHHLESRKTGGDSPDNLVTLCETCHSAFHKGVIKLKLRRKSASLRDAAFMGIMRWTFYERLKAGHPDIPVENTYGYITKNLRIVHGIEKTHCADAFCIAGNLGTKRLKGYIYQKQVRKHNRQIHKATIRKGGQRRLNQAPYLVQGFRLYDKVKVNRETGFIFGRRSSGYFDVRRLDGTKISAAVSCRKLTVLETKKTFLTKLRNKEAAIPPST